MATSWTVVVGLLDERAGVRQDRWLIAADRDALAAKRPTSEHWGHAFGLASTVARVALVMGACSSQSAPSSFTTRVAPTSCGEIHLGQGEAVPSDAWRCLDSASGTGAELAVDMPTSEGDPIVTYDRVGPPIDGLEIFVDTTQDGFGQRAWTHELCPDTIAAREPLGYEEL